MSEQAYQSILDHLPFVAFVLNADGTIVCSNPPSADLTGKRSSELAGHGLTAALGDVEGAADIVDALTELPDAGETGLTVVVASRGPPLVITSICVNSENAAIVMVISTKIAVGRRPGQVTYLNFCQVPAPSTSAAS